MKLHKRRCTSAISQKRQSHKVSLLFSAYHEIGHAVMIHHEGLSVSGVSVSGDLSGMALARIPVDESGVPVDIPRSIRIFMAGPYVQRWAVESYPENIDSEEKKKYLVGGWMGDMEQVNMLGEKLNPPDGLSEQDLQSYWSDVESILKPYSEAIIKLANKLWENRSLSSDEIKAALEAHDKSR